MLKSVHFCAEIDKKVLKYGYHSYKNTDLLSNSTREAYGYNYSLIGTYIYSLSFHTMICDLW